MSILYVRKEGSDSNNGTSVALAKLTLASAMSTASNNDTINIGRGGWYETIGLGGKKLTFQGAGRNLTTVIGTIYISGNSIFNDLTVSLNANYANDYSGVTFSNVTIYGNGYGGTQPYWLYTSSGSNPFTATNTIFANVYYSNYYLIGVAGPVTLNHCVLYKCGGFYFFASNQAISIKNCIMHGDGNQPVYLWNDPGNNFTHKNNIWYQENRSGPDNTGWGFSPDATESYSMPLWTDKTGMVLTLREGSIGINTGTAS